MGQVWQATDTQLNRQVALKILPDAFAADPDRLARFTREAQILASLNHPNIAAIYGIEEAEGTRALVLELVEGPTLADRIAKGAIPLDEALPIAKQIAEALEAAHEAGVIHRDLKPANIKVREDGTVKVLDFGLAKAFQPDASDPNMSMSPTISLTAAATQMGMVIGTPAYMSPEQAKGKVVDKRADVWAFGAVFYEMLTGTKPFTGKDASDTLAAVLRIDVDLDALPATTPPRLRQLLGACLQKDTKDRLRDVGDARLAMNGVFDTPTPPNSTQGPASQLHVWQRPLPALAVAMAVLAVGGLVVWGGTRSDGQLPVVTRFSVLTPRDAALRVAQQHSDIAISADGSRIVYGAGDTVGRGVLQVRDLNQRNARPLPGTEGGVSPFFSPDGGWIGFRDPTDNMLKKVSVLGGPPVPICEVGRLRGASWGADDTIVFAAASGDLMRVPASGGEPAPVTSALGGAGIDHRWPDLLPGGAAEAVLFTEWNGSPEESRLAVISLAISEFPKWRKYLISLSFRGQSSVRPVQVGGFDVNIVIHRSTAVRGRGGPARHDAWPPSLGAILPTRTGPVEADGAVDAQNAPTAPWKTRSVFHELPQGFSHQITHEKHRKAPK